MKGAATHSTIHSTQSTKKQKKTFIFSLLSFRELFHEMEVK